MIPPSHYWFFVVQNSRIIINLPFIVVRPELSLVLEYIHGSNLEDYLKQTSTNNNNNNNNNNDNSNNTYDNNNNSKSEDILPSVRLLLDVALAIQHLHYRNIIHR